MDSDEPNDIILTEEEKAENEELFQQYLKEECDRIDGKKHKKMVTGSTGTAIQSKPNVEYSIYPQIYEYYKACKIVDSMQLYRVIEILKQPPQYILFALTKAASSYITSLNSKAITQSNVISELPYDHFCYTNSKCLSQSQYTNLNSLQVHGHIIKTDITGVVIASLIDINKQSIMINTHTRAFIPLIYAKRDLSKTSQCTIVINSSQKSNISSKEYSLHTDCDIHNFPNQKGTWCESVFDNIVIFPKSSNDLPKRKTLQKAPFNFGIRNAFSSLKMLNLAAPTLKVGSALLYITNTMNPLENECVIDNFLYRHKEFSLTDIKLSLNDIKLSKGVYNWQVVCTNENEFMRCIDYYDLKSTKQRGASPRLFPRMNTQLEKCVRVYPQKASDKPIFIAQLVKLKENSNIDDLYEKDVMQSADTYQKSIGDDLMDFLKEFPDSQTQSSIDYLKAIKKPDDVMPMKEYYSKIEFSGKYNDKFFKSKDVWDKYSYQNAVCLNGKIGYKVSSSMFNLLEFPLLVLINFSSIGVRHFKIRKFKRGPVVKSYTNLSKLDIDDKMEQLLMLKGKCDAKLIDVIKLKESSFTLQSKSTQFNCLLVGSTILVESMIKK